MKHFEALLNRGLEITLAMCLLAIATIVVTLVVLRYVFNSSIAGANEMVTILFVFTTSLGAALATGKREHITIPFAFEALPQRGQKLVDRLGLILVAILNLVMLGYSIGWIRVTGGYLMPSTGLPRAVAQASVPLGCGLAIAYCLLRLFSGDEKHEPSESEGRADSSQRVAE